MTEGRTAIVAMSGGVDSSVAAGLLLQQGYRVVGITLSFVPCGDDQQVSWCCGVGAQTDARAVAQKLGFPHYTIDCVDQFESHILRTAWQEYDHGRTPSPCVACNGQIKFAKLLELMKKFGADTIATGHYARVRRAASADAVTLWRGVDPQKDQSYFLFTLTPEQLEHVAFPLGELEKTRVRALAQEMDLVNAERPESQDACFVQAGTNFAESLRRRFGAPARPGRVVDPKGQELGAHQGIHQFTIGQRKGLNIALGHRAWVTGINAERAEVVLNDDPDALLCRTLRATAVSWIGGEQPSLPAPCEAQIRSRHRAAPAVIEADDQGVVQVRFDEPQRAITPGQAVVFYRDERVLGGGWIE